MAKNTMIPMPAGKSSGVAGKLVGTTVLLALLVIVVKHPTDAASWLKDLIGFGASVVDGIASFIRHVAA